MARAFRRTLWQSLVDAGDHHLALFRCVRLGDRLPDDARSTAFPMARSSCPGLIMLSLFTREHLQRELRHPSSRNSPARSTNCSRRRSRRLRDGPRLCRRGGDQVDHPRRWSSSPPRILFVRRPTSSTRCWMVALPDPDRGDASACSASSSASGRRVSSSSSSSRC